MENIFKTEILTPSVIDPEELFHFVCETDSLFTPPLSYRIDIKEYSYKMASKATLFITRQKDEILACNAVYVNPRPGFSYATFLAVKKEYEHLGIGARLILKAIKYAQQQNSSSYELQMRASNIEMLEFYKKLGFKIINIEPYPHSKELMLTIKKEF